MSVNGPPPELVREQRKYIESCSKNKEQPMNLTLPTDSAERKNYPLLRGALRYAPAAVAMMANTSKLGNDKHNPGEEMYHARGKSSDHGDCVVRHLVDIQDILAHLQRNCVTGAPTVDDYGLARLEEELGQFIWRAALYVQETAEQYLGAPKAPGAR